MNQNPDFVKFLKSSVKLVLGRGMDRVSLSKMAAPPGRCEIGQAVPSLTKPLASANLIWNPGSVISETI